MLEQLITQTADDINDVEETGENPANTAIELPSKHSHKEDDVVNELSTVTQDTLTLDSVPAVVNDTINSVKGDKVMADTADTQASNGGDVTDSEVCFYYDSSQYNKAVTAVNGDVIDRDVTTSINTPDLDQIINGYPLRMYKRTAKVL